MQVDVQTIPSLHIDALCESVYTELKNIAAWHLSTTSINLTLEATDLVHEAISRVIRQRKVDWNERSHLLAIASIMIRRVLMNHIRFRSASIRGGKTNNVTLAVEPVSHDSLHTSTLIELHEAINRLEIIDERQARIVEMKYFGDMQTKDIAVYLDISERSVQLGWSHARLWLYRELSDG